MTAIESLRRQFDGKDGSFLFRARCELDWDWDAFRELTSAIYEIADNVRGKDDIETWIAHGFWFFDTWIQAWTSHPDFRRPDKEAYDDAIELIHELSFFLLFGESPYEDDTLKTKAMG